MKVGEIKELLAEFYEGRTTEEQEEVLREYFETQDVPEYLLTDKNLFLSFREITGTELPTGLEDKLIRLIDEKAAEEKRFMVENKTRINWKWIGSVAASLLLIFGLGYGTFQLHTYSKPEDTFSDPQDAFRTVQAVLIEISANLNDGMAQLIEVEQDVNEISNEIIEEIQ